MLRLVLPLLMFATPTLAHEGMHHHPHGIEFGWVGVALLSSLVGGVLTYAILRRRK